MSADTLTLTRPDDVSDARWAAMKSMAHRMVTGHAPWCSAHEPGLDGDGGWCAHTITTFAAEVLIHNSGGLSLNLRPLDGVDLGDLTPEQAAAIAVALDLAVSTVRDLSWDE